VFFITAKAAGKAVAAEGGTKIQQGHAKDSALFHAIMKRAK
jgi:hypothetical protein